MIRVAVIGIGSFGKNHARILKQSDAVELAAIVDQDKSRSDEIASQFSVKVCTDLNDIVREIDAAVVVTPTSAHYDVAKVLLGNGIHVFVEKPITSNSKEAEELIELAKNKNLVLQVGHIERFNPAFLSVRKSIKKPIYLEANRVSQFPERIKDTDVIMDMMIHDIDIILHLVNSSVREIKSIGMNVLTNKTDMANVRLEFENGSVANVSTSRVANDRYRKLRVFEKDRYYSIDFLNKTAYMAEISTVNNKKEIKITNPELALSDPLQMELSQFFAAIQGKDNFGVTGEEGLRALKVVEEIVKNINLV